MEGEEGRDEEIRCESKGRASKRRMKKENEEEREEERRRKERI